MRTRASLPRGTVSIARVKLLSTAGSRVKPHDWPAASELANSVRRRELKATEILDEAVAAIERLNPLINAWVELDIDQARRAALAVDATVERGEDPGPLAGIPLGVKDLEDLAGLPTREGSELFRTAPPVERDSVHVARLRAAGAIPLGKTTTPEFGLTWQTTTQAYGVTRNPWDRGKTPGGSSGGSAAAVASGMVPLATASDGGGSTRIPAAFSGLVGLKPSHGRIPYPRPGEQSVLGALAVSVVDLARHLDVAAGPDGSDHQSLPAADVRYEEAIETLDLSGLRGAWSVDLGWMAVDAEIAQAAEEAMRHIVEVSGIKLVDRPFWVPNGGLAWGIMAAEQVLRRLTHLGAWPDRAEALEPGTRSTIEVSIRLGPEHLYRADERRRQIIAATADMFREVDVIFTPGSAMTAPPAVGPPPEEIGGSDARLSGPAPFTWFVNYAWNPAIAVPVGLHSNGLPMGLQIVGPRHRDEIPLRLARLLEVERPWPRRPDIVDEAEPSPPPVVPEIPVEVMQRVFKWAVDLGHDGTQFTDELVAELVPFLEQAGLDDLALRSNQRRAAPQARSDPGESRR